MYENRNGTDIYYYYDSYGTPTAIRYYETVENSDGSSETVSYMFYLATNQQGDIIGIYNASGNMVVKYEYDAWGNIISTTDANGGALNGLSQKWSDINPFRYRGYYYDAETELYYLQSRYYDAEVGRFLNADVLLDNRDLNTINPFAYCGNNPVAGNDPCGTCFHRWDFWNACENCGGQTLKDKLIDYYENGITLNGSVGLYGSFNLGAFNVNGSVEIAFDLKGNIQIIGSVSFDVTSDGNLSASGGVTTSLYAMPDTSYYAGDTYYMGGSMAVENPACPAVAVGVGGNVGRTSDGYWGVDGSLGIGTITSVGGEFHSGYSKTAALTEQFNVFEFIVSLF